jgi:MerR family copper efflux transcriptional regulator
MMGDGLTFNPGRSLTVASMTSTEGHRISEVAARTGFSASAIRFYEDAGLVEPARTPSGYRVYDERSVERLRFIARGKDLGLSLDEIAELLPAWEVDSCADVAGRLGSQVADKVAATRARITELTAFVADLETAGHRLAREVSDGPCDDACACAPPAHGGRTAVSIASAPAVDTSAAAPIACALGPADTTARIEQWRGLVGAATGREHIAGGVRLHYRAGTDLGPIAALVEAELQCCSFFTFFITVSSGGVTVDVSAPPEARPMVDELVGGQR